MSRKPDAKRKRSRYEVDQEKLVRAWQLASSLDEVIEQTGYPRHIVTAWIKKIREAGVPLKEIRRVRIDVERLTRVAKEADKS